MAFVVVTYEGDRRYSDAATYTIGEASGVLTVVDDDGAATSYSPRGWFRVTHLR